MATSRLKQVNLNHYKDGIENGFNVKIIKNGHTNWLKEAEDKINEVNKKLEDMGIILL